MADASSALTKDSRPSGTTRRSPTNRCTEIVQIPAYLHPSLGYVERTCKQERPCTVHDPEDGWAT